MFVPLHVKSDFSAGHGATTVERLVEVVAARGWPALALTDVENMCGVVRLHRAARARGLKAIAGVELRAGFTRGEVGRRAGRLVLLARDRGGYESLCRIVTRRRARAESTPPPLSCLEAVPRGLFFLSDDRATIDALLRTGVPASDVRFLMASSGAGSAPPGVRGVADLDVVMADPEDWGLHRLRVAIHRGERLASLTVTEPPEHSFPGAAALDARFRDVPEALHEAALVAEACSLDLGSIRPDLPSPRLHPGETAKGRLRWLSGERLRCGRRSGRLMGRVYDHRLENELAVVSRLGFAGYFLIAAEIVDAARARQIPLLGRGSAVGSLLAYVLGLTSVDPVARGLSFERFLHEGRPALPDIDLDVPSGRRDELIEWVFHQFGPERVAMVSAHQTFGRRSALRHGLRALGLGEDAIDRFARRLPSDDLDEDVAPPLPIDLLPERYRAAVPLLQRLVGTFQHVSVHPGGVVIAEPRLDAHVALERAPKGVLVTQYDMRSLAELGLVKLDLLGNRALEAVTEVGRALGGPIAAPDGDPDTLTTLREGRTVGCFQIETPAMRSILKRLPIEGTADLATALALVRPGPTAGKAKAAFIRRARGDEPPVPFHPRVADVLRKSHGMLLHDEDLMACIAAITGWSLGRAGDLRSALVGIAPPCPASALEEEFTSAALSTGLPADEAAAVWETLRRFAAYTFSKAHAASYAELAWYSAYLKTHHPVHFAAAVLNSYGGHYPLRTVAADLARAGVRLFAPDVNISAESCAVEGGAVRIGFRALKHLSAKSRQRILASRPFGDFRQLLAAVPLAGRELEALVLSGACDRLSPLTAEGYPFAQRDALERHWPEGAGSRPRRHLASAGTPALEIYRALVRARNELAYLEMHPTEHPMRILRAEAARADCVPLVELAGQVGRPVRVAGLVAAARRLATRRRQVMQFVTIEDESDLVEAVLFPGTYASLGDPVTGPGPFIFAGRVQVEDGDQHLVISHVLPFHRRSHPYRQLEAIG